MKMKRIGIGALDMLRECIHEVTLTSCGIPTNEKLPSTLQRFVDFIMTFRHCTSDYSKIAQALPF